MISLMKVHFRECISTREIQNLWAASGGKVLSKKGWWEDV